MSIWKVLAAATSELSVGGQISSLLGGRATHGPARGHKVAEPDNEVPFTVGVIMLGAKMAKADGRVTSDEVEAFKEAFNVSPAEMKHAARIFNLAKQDMSGYESCAQQLVTVFNGNRKLLEDVLDGLFYIAKADEEVHPQEEEFLGRVAKLFGFAATEFNSIKARHLLAARRNPYDVLGVDRSVSDEELERHYRRLVADNQPDELIGRGVPKEFINIATEKLATLNEAYDAIVKERSR